MKDIYGLIGDRLGHSFSADYFNHKFGIEHINAEYCLFPLEKIEDIVDLFREYPNIHGLNVTIPYKESVMRFVNDVSEEASEIGAVNVLRIEHGTDGKPRIFGYNTDVIGFQTSLMPMLSPLSLSQLKALVLGTGGASKAVTYVLRKCGIGYRCVSRNPRLGTDDLAYSQLTPAIVEECKLIVNCTPLGMWPNVDAAPDIPYEGITPEHRGFDLVYNPKETLFMKKMKEQGAKVKNGLEMLHIQAEEAWTIWNKLNPRNS